MANVNKRKSYTIKEKLPVIEKVKSGVLKEQIKRELGIPEGTIRGWIAEEGRLRSFLDKLDKTPGLERKKSRLCKNDTVDDCLYTRFVQKRSLGFPLSGPILKMQAEKFFQDLKLVGGRSQWSCGLRRGSWPVGCWDRGFESRSRHGCLSASFCVVLSCVDRGLATG
jgi:hypothetical protein